LKRVFGNAREIVAQRHLRAIGSHGLDLCQFRRFLGRPWNNGRLYCI
jgi:hypothetical protein